MSGKKLAAFVVLIAAITAATTLALQTKEAPSAIDYADIGDFVFVPSLAAAEVTIVNSFTDEVVGTIALPQQADEVLVSQGAGALISTDIDTKTVSIQNFGAGTVIDTIQLSFSPTTIVLGPRGLTAAVADPEDGSIGIIDLVARTLQTSLSGLNRPADLTFSDDSSELYFTDSVTDEVRVIDVDEGVVAGAIGLSIGGTSDGGSATVNASVLSAVTRTPNGRYGLCVEPKNQRLAVVNFGDKEEIKTLRLGADPSRPYGTADGRYMLIANNGDRTVTIVTTDTFDVVATLEGAADVTAINTGYFETYAFVISGSEKKAIVLDLMEMKNIGEIPFSGTPGPGVVTVDGMKMYVALSDTNELAVVDMESHELLTTIGNVGHSPWGATMLQTNNYCH